MSEVAKMVDFFGGLIRITQGRVKLNRDSISKVIRDGLDTVKHFDTL